MDFYVFPEYVSLPWQFGGHNCVFFWISLGLISLVMQIRRKIPEKYVAAFQEIPI